MTRAIQLSLKDAVEGIECADCGAETVRVWCNTKFRYALGKDAVELPVRLPYWHCKKCGSGCIDGYGAMLKDEAVFRHLGRLLPRKIRDLRYRFKMSCDEFAEIFDVEEELITKWECGLDVPSPGQESLLRQLLKDERESS